jgi:hypothetical protein
VVLKSAVIVNKSVLTNGIEGCKMNERMAELFGQAGISDSINEEFGIEYLVQLIVKECISMADEFEIDVNRSGLVDRMKEHFGVK